MARSASPDRCHGQSRRAAARRMRCTRRQLPATVAAALSWMSPVGLTPISTQEDGATSGEHRGKLREFQGDRLVLAQVGQHSDGLLWRRIAVIGSG